jgi:hypothetical protein
MNQIMNGCVTGKARALMFENTPRMVCLPEPGSMWTPSQVIHTSSCGFDCTGRTWAARAAEGNLFGDGRTGGVQTGGMELFQRLLAPLAAYPRWFVVTCLVLVALAAGWLLARLVKWTLWLLLAAGVLLLILVAVVWLVGG